MTAQAVRVVPRTAQPSDRAILVHESRGRWLVSFRVDTFLAVAAGVLVSAHPLGPPSGAVVALVGFTGAIGLSSLWAAVLRGVAHLRHARLPGLPSGLPIRAATRLSRLVRRSLMLDSVVGFAGVAAVSWMPTGLPAGLAAGGAVFLVVGAVRACLVLRVFAMTPVLGDQ